MTRPLPLILARNLLSSMTTPGVLVDGGGSVAFFNDAAGALLGRRYEESGPLSAAAWTAAYGQELRGNPASHHRVRLRTATGERELEATGVPIHGEDGFQGAMVFLWPLADDGAPA
jgi:PAS domain-containing protein